jgi:hypothetical protein
MGAGAERAAGIDDDRELPSRRGLPRRSDPERADLDGVVELAPAVLPALGDLLDERSRELGDDPRGGLTVRGELDRCAVIPLLEPFRGELDEPGAELLGLGGRCPDGRANQRKALFSFSKKLWSGR